MLWQKGSHALKDVSGTDRLKPTGGGRGTGFSGAFSDTGFNRWLQPAYERRLLLSRAIVYRFPMPRAPLLLLPLLLLCGCAWITRSADVRDVTRPETIVLRKFPRQGSVLSLVVVGRGRIDGDAQIALLLDGQPYKTETLSGEVDFRWGGDWYADEAEIRYTPGSVAGGRLRLKYRFNDL